MGAVRGRIVAALACAALVGGCAAGPRGGIAPPLPVGSSGTPVAGTPVTEAPSAPGLGPLSSPTDAPAGASAGSPASPGALPSGRTPSTPPPTRPATATPFRVNGIVLVNRQHRLTSGYVPPYDTADHLAPELEAALKDLRAGAEAAGYSLSVRSGYRSYADQAGSYTRAVATYGHDVADAQFAPPGASEHQTGLAVDLAAPGGYKGYEFKKLPVAAWVAAHATDYGLIVRYPQGGEAITGYDWEAWHVRYVGREVAAAFAQRPGLTLEEYLGLA